MLLVSTFFMVVGYTLMYAGIRSGPNQKYARAPWQLLVDAAKRVPAATGVSATASLIPGIGGVAPVTTTVAPEPAVPGYFAPVPAVYALPAA